MHDLKEIRKDLEKFQKQLKGRNIDININNLKDLDEKNRGLIQKKEILESEKKEISKSKDKNLFERSKEISKKLDIISSEQKKIKIKLDDILSSIPNIPHIDVPIGVDEKDNVEISKSGIIPDFDFKPKTHYELGENLNMLDFDLATKTTGSRFVFVKDKLALLERALSNYMLDKHVLDNGYNEISPPLLASENTMYGTGQLPKFEEDQFEIKFNDVDQRKFLIPTAEVVLTNLVRKSQLSINDLPLRFVASTPCFRKEAGSYGKDTKGMMRQHQFYKVELVSIVEPKNCMNELERMLNCAEEILKKLDIPYQIKLLSSGDMGFSAEKTFDIETWIPSEDKYREISSCSSCGSFQARRMNAKYKSLNGSEFLGTLNGSGLAVGRLMISLIENNQNQDGSISIPNILKKYMNNLDKI